MMRMIQIDRLDYVGDQEYETIVIPVSEVQQISYNRKNGFVCFCYGKEDTVGGFCQDCMEIEQFFEDLSSDENSTLLLIRLYESLSTLQELQVQE